MNAKTRARTIAALEKAVVDFTRPEKIRRACALRLSRLRAATKPAAPAPKPAPVAPTEDAKFQAYQAFRALCAQRSALIRKRKTAAELEIFHTMIALMPGGVPNHDDQNGWRDFIARVDATLSEIKTITII